MSIRTILAPNPGPMTLTGTNTYVITGGAAPALVVDPGPRDAGHLAAILAACPQGIGEIWLTHHHHDHTEAVPALVEATGAPVRAARESLCDRAPALTDGEQVIVGPGDPGHWCGVTPLAIPGHTDDSIGMLVEAEGEPAALLTGDMVLGTGTTVITHPDGDLAAFFTSLDVMEEVVSRHSVADLLPGHGPRVDDPAGVLNYYRRHRRDRLDQVRAAVEAGARTPAEVVDAVYVGLTAELRPAAEQSATAQLEYLRAGN